MMDPIQMLAWLQRNVLGVGMCVCQLVVCWTGFSADIDVVEVPYKTFSHRLVVVLAGGCKIAGKQVVSARRLLV